MLKVLVNISGDRTLHLSWQGKNWYTVIRNELNIKDIDTQKDSYQDVFPTQSKKEIPWAK
jgi:hypothetical protein